MITNKRINIRSLASILYFDKSVLYGILAKFWSMLFGPLAALLITHFFSSVEQGYYYTFNTILAMQVFVELGLGVVIQQFSSHEWSGLSLDQKGEIIGDEENLSRLSSIAKFSVRWFLLAGIFIALGLMVGGYIFFSTSANSGNIHWIAPWVCLSILTGANILLTPIWSILEGCNQVKNLYKFRLILSLFSAVSFSTSVLLGANLWTAAIGTFISIAFSVYFIRRKYWNFFKSLFTKHFQGPKINWKGNMLPMQWRVAVSWISGYFCFYLFTPILFKYQGPVVAGKFGMTWSIITAISGVANAWLAPRVPQFGMLIAKKDYINLHILLRRIVTIILIITLTFSVLVWLFIFFLPHVNWKITKLLSSRLLDPLPVALILAGQALQIISTPFSSYLRAHRREPLMYLSILNGILVGFTTFLFGKYYSVTEVAAAYLGVSIIINPLAIVIWSRFQKNIYKH